jgi:CheY-like chemotaxis protein
MTNSKIDLTGRTILIAEDDEPTYLYFDTVLRTTGAGILWAKDGHKVVEMCQKEANISLIIMDGMMPGMSGYQAIREIRTFLSKVPIILVTAYVSSASIQEAISSGCSDYLGKPLGNEELIAILTKWLGPR